MESMPQSVLTARPPCQCHHGLTEQPPKILHSILSYHFNHYDVADPQGSSRAEGGPGSTCSSPGCSSPRDSYSPALSHASGGYRSPSPCPAPNPSPSPPAAWAESKLYNILKGNSPGCATATSGNSSRPSSSSSSYSSSSSSSSSSGYSSASPLPMNLKRARDTSDEPMDLSCKKLHVEEGGSRSSTPVNTGLPMDLSSRSNTPRSVTSSPLAYTWTPQAGAPGTNTDFKYGPVPSDSAASAANNNNNTTPSSSSILKSILCGQVSSGLLGGRAPTPSSSPCSPAPSPLSSAPSPQPSSPVCFPSSPRCHSSSQMVTLAKKNLYPVSARVSDWLVKIVQFANTLPEFISLSHNDKVQLVLNSWARLLLLYMAENNFHFAVTPMGSEESQDEKVASSPDTPTMRSVESVQGYLRKCQSLNLDSKEYDYIRMITLFKQGYTGVENPQYIESISSYVRQSLQDHIRATRPKERLRYSHILLALPTLFGVNTKMVEKLFCKHISTNMDVEVLLKEMLQKLS